VNEKKTLLVVEDDHDVLDLLEVYLYKRYDLHIAMNGFEGLTRAEELIPDCIISDIMMPVMNGIKFFNELRKRDNCNKIPVVAITSYSKDITSKSLINMGFSTVITKPFTQEQITTAVAHVLAEEHSV
jgi:CheY-like chemotaxis protein